MTLVVDKKDIHWWLQSACIYAVYVTMPFISTFNVQHGAPTRAPTRAVVPLFPHIGQTLSQIGVNKDTPTYFLPTTGNGQSGSGEGMIGDRGDRG